LHVGRPVPTGLKSREKKQIDLNSRPGARYSNGAFVGQHGSWNRKPQSSYVVIYFPFAGGRPSSPPVEVVYDFLNAKGEARGVRRGGAWRRRCAARCRRCRNTIWRFPLSHAPRQLRNLAFSFDAADWRSLSIRAE